MGSRVRDGEQLPARLPGPAAPQARTRAVQAEVPAHRIGHGLPLQAVARVSPQIPGSGGDRACARRGKALGVRQSLVSVRQALKGRKPSRAWRPAALAERIERAHVLDPVIHELSDSVVRALPAGARTDALHGVPFGQPAHPALVRLPLGCWTSAVLLEAFPGTQRASGLLIAGGIAGTAPAAATGLADWSALHRDQQRVGLVHAVCQTTAATLFLGSLAARASGRTGYGRVLSASGLAVASIGSYLGGHLALRLGAGASHAEQVSHLAGLGWHDLCDLDELPERH